MCLGLQVSIGEGEPRLRAYEEDDGRNADCTLTISDKHFESLVLGV